MDGIVDGVRMESPMSEEACAPTRTNLGDHAGGRPGNCLTFPLMGAGPNAITIGNFDGVHIGHVALVRRARECVSGPGGRVIALAFDPHPSTLLRPESVPDRLTTFEQRAQLLAQAGADEVVRLEPTHAQLSLSPEEFVCQVVERYEPAAIVEGSDFRFGKDRRGTVELLRSLGRVHGFEAHVVDPVDVDLMNQHIVRASSSLIRWLLAHGRVQDAARVLGKDYQLSGPVTRGDRRGRVLGLPTANVRTACVLPLAGVYAAIATLPDGQQVPAAVSVGPRPTFDSPEPRLEAFLILRAQPAPGQPLQGLSEYGWNLSLCFRAFLREQLKFDSVEALQSQMHRDCARALELMGQQACTVGNGVMC